MTNSMFERVRRRIKDGDFEITVFQYSRNGSQESVIHRNIDQYKIYKDRIEFREKLHYYISNKWHSHYVRNVVHRKNIRRIAVYGKIIKN